ncbi:DUF485 domain-containing protein [Pseudoxanthobacter sp.]|uniref:DUF485 domain-containing protein n=1 Tax=Pseudoxanthobacter sp. TaxID=1925742 RepID=UPI002FDF8099
MKSAYDKIAADPRFAELVARRNRFSLTLSFIVLGVYAIFVIVAIGTPALFATPVVQGGVWTIGIIGGFCVQIFAFIMTGIYTARANGPFDRATRAIIEEATR